MPKRKPRIDVPTCPASLTGEAAVEWKRITKLLKERGLIAKLDRAGLALYCQAWARWMDSEAKLLELGTVVKSPSGYPIQNPYLSIANAAAKQINAALASFGLHPVSRKRLQKGHDDEYIDADPSPPVPPGKHIVGRAGERNGEYDEYAFTCVACGHVDAALPVRWSSTQFSCPMCGTIGTVDRDDQGLLALIINGGPCKGKGNENANDTVR